MGLRKKVKHWLHQSKKPPSNSLGLQFEPFGWLLSRDPTGLVETTLTSGKTAEDQDLVRRVMKAYQRADAAFEATSSFWDKGIRNLNQNIHDALSGDDVDAAAALLRNPADTNHFWGFDAVCSAPAGKITSERPAGPDRTG